MMNDRQMASLSMNEMLREHKEMKNAERKEKRTKRFD